MKTSFWLPMEFSVIWAGQLLKKYWASVAGRRFSNIPTTPSLFRYVQPYWTQSSTSVEGQIT